MITAAIAITLALLCALVVIGDQRRRFRRAVHDASELALRQMWDRVVITGTSKPVATFTLTSEAYQNLRGLIVDAEREALYGPQHDLAWNEASMVTPEMLGRPVGTFLGMPLVVNDDLPPDQIYLINPNQTFHYPINPTEETP